jgi:hypothetical protein
MDKAELVTLVNEDDKPVFSADPATMNEWLIANPPPGSYGVQLLPGKKIVTIDYFLASMEGN